MRSILFILTLFISVPLLKSQSNYPVIVIETNYGTMKAILYDDTPVHSNHYLNLIKEKYFDGTLFHRVIKDFMIQGGAQDSRNVPQGFDIGGGRTDIIKKEHLHHREEEMQRIPKRNQTHHSYILFMDGYTHRVD